MRIITYIIIISLIGFTSCQEESSNYVDPSADTKFKTENIVLIVIDGPRNSETWGDELRRNIPYQNNLAKTEGVLFSNFYNDGITFTLAGHTAITTGHYQKITNNGIENPEEPSVFQRYLSETKAPPTDSWIITSKSKLHALKDCQNLNWHGSYQPSIDTKDRVDEKTLTAALTKLEEFTPTLSMIHFRGPDTKGHANDWSGYIEKIKETDAHVAEIWDFLQSNEHYQGKTTLLVTADHGRHLDGIGSGFIGHGDSCNGCKYIYLLAIGPDFKENQVISKHYGQINIAPTIAKLLNFRWHGDGKPINELISK